MKRFSQKYYVLTILLSFLFLLFQVYAFAQDTTTTTTTTSTASSTLPATQWYMQPWAWIAGGVALLLILIAAFSGGSKKDKATSRTDRVIITKTVRTEHDNDD